MYDKSVAVIGCGFIGPVHVEALRRLGITVKGVLGSSPLKSKRAAEAMGLSMGWDSLDDLLKDDEIGVVHITSPNKYHFEQTKKCLESGKHVMCEKPLTMSSSESASLLEIASGSGLITGVNYNIRYYPLNIESRIRSKKMGAIHEVSGSYVQDWLLKKSDYNWRVLSDVSGPLRAVSDIGTHWLDLICFITGKTIESVCADLYNIHPVRERPAGEVETFSNENTSNFEEVQIDTEDGGNVLIRFSDGSRGSLRVSQVAAGRKNKISYEICGAQETIAWDGESPNSLWIGRRDEMNQQLIKNPALQSSEANYFTSYPGGHAEGFPDSHKQCFKAFYDAVLGNHPSIPHPSFEDGHKELLICDAILKSALESRWVKIEK
ncbi:MAG: Gfo/Idh/MocA family oxidoreductase [Spirochaetales bacterium]|nr:Gfo/Idh/MocA family oxidoreductase [Spirochaetales bacterium]